MILFLLGVAVGVLCTFIIFKSRKSGNLVIVDDPIDGAFMFLEINKEVPEIRKHKAVSLNVVNEEHLLKE